MILYHIKIKMSSFLIEVKTESRTLLDTKTNQLDKKGQDTMCSVGGQ